MKNGTANLIVKVYWNINKDCWSIKYKGKVVFYAKIVHLRNVTFKVSEAGRQRVLKEKRKNVHAFVVGELVSTDLRIEPKLLDSNKQITYNPYLFSYFFNKKTLEEVKAATGVFLLNKMVFEV